MKSFEDWLEQNNSYTNTTPTNIGAGRGLGGTAQVRARDKGRWSESARAIEREREDREKLER